jgi:hypothetical protein
MFFSRDTGSIPVGFDQMTSRTTPESASAQEALSKLVEWCDRNDWGTVPDKLEAMCRNALLSETKESAAPEAEVGRTPQGEVTTGAPVAAPFSSDKHDEPRAYLFNGHAFTPNLLTSDQRARAVPLYALPSAKASISEEDREGLECAQTIFRCVLRAMEAGNVDEFNYDKESTYYLINEADATIRKLTAVAESRNTQA